MKRLLAQLIIIVFSIFAFQPFLNAQIQIVSGINGEVYNQFANDIGNNTLINTQIYTSKGSIENLQLLRSDSIQLAFIQYDVLHDLGKNNEKIKDVLKVFLPLYNEEIQLITLRGNGIKDVSNLIGKRVGMGGENSGSSFTAHNIKVNSGIDWEDFVIPFSQSVDALVSGKIDAFFFVGAAPSNLLTSLSSDIQNKLVLVPISLPQGDDCYIKRTIPANTYKWQKKAVKTYAVKSLIAVNVNNVDAHMAGMIDTLYADLKDNLKGIKLNKFSHPKWKSVEFSDMENVDWPVFKEEYTLKERLLDYIGWIAALLSFIQIYFIVNKLWKRKHEQLVAESISISAMFISLFINLFFAITNISQGGYAQLSGNILWVVASSISMLIGMGLFVKINKGLGFFKLLGKALNMERHEAGDLAKAFFLPSSADKIIDILGRLAMIDNDLDETEKKYIQKFADSWNIEIDWEEVEKYLDESGDRYNKLRDSLNDYLRSMPPKEQATNLIDVIALLINADGKVTREEKLMQSELTGIIMEYIGEGGDVDYFKVAVVPQNKDQENAITSRFSELERVEFAGGFAYLSEGYYSEDYAEEVSSQYRSFHVFSVVFKPNIMKDEELMNKIDSQINK